MTNNLTFYRELYKIRRFEETVLNEFSSGVFKGTTHTYLGQEANAVGVLSRLNVEDLVFSNHRCHGHFLAYGGDAHALFAELMGKPTGVGGGRGGSQHIHWKNFYSNGIQGSALPIATGSALAEKFKGNNAICVAFLGDGTLGQGVLYETLNLASLWSAPILFVVENNRIAQTTPIKLGVAGKISARFEAFDIPTKELDTSNVQEIFKIAGEQIQAVRQTAGPQALILNTYRFGPHSKGDDTRSTEEVTKIRETRDPLKIHAENLGKEEKAKIDHEIDAEMATAFSQAKGDAEGEKK